MGVFTRLSTNSRSEPNILATSSEEWFFKNLAIEDSAGGFIPRWVIVKAGIGKSVPTPPPLDPAGQQPLAEQLKKIDGLREDADLSKILPLYGEWYGPTKERFSAQASPVANAYFNRHRGHILKLAVIYEASISQTLTVSERAWEMAQTTARILENMIFDLLGTGMSASGYELKKMEDRIRSAGPKGITRSELTRAFQHDPSRDRDERLRTLDATGQVVTTSRQGGGRPGVIYTHRDFVTRTPDLAA